MSALPDIITHCANTIYRFHVLSSCAGFAMSDTDIMILHMAVLQSTRQRSPGWVDKILRHCLSIKLFTVNVGISAGYMHRGLRDAKHMYKRYCALKHMPNV